MRVSVLASGSKGNCTLVEDGKTAFLIDMGISMRQLKQELAKFSINIEDLDGIFITHEHSDHIKGLVTLTKHYNLPLMTRRNTFKNISQNINLTNPNFVCINPKEGFKAGSMMVTNFSVSHDAADPCGYFIQGNKSKVTIATDLGVASEVLAGYISQSQGIVLEANYDGKLLRNGNYPLMLKQRIAGAYGHLANEATGKLLANLQNIPDQIILAHLSKENNRPSLAVTTVQNHLDLAGFDVSKYKFMVGKEKEATTMVVEE